MKLSVLKMGFFILFAICSKLNGMGADIQFYNVAETHSINIREVYSVCSDNEGFIWASSKTGIFRLSENSYSFYQLPLESANSFWVKLAFNKGTLIAFANNGQIFRYNVLMNRFDRLLNIKEVDGTFPGITDLVIDRNQRLWISSATGLFKFDGKLTKIAAVKETVFSLTFKSENELLAASQTEIVKLNINSLKALQLFKLPSKTEATAIAYNPASNRILLGTLSSGLIIYDLNDPVPMAVKSSLPHQPVRAIVPDTDSTVLIGIDGAGIWKLNSRNGKVMEVYKENPDDPKSLQGNGVYSIHIDRQQRVWVGTYTGGLSFFEMQMPSVRQLSHQTANSHSLINNNVNKIIEDSGGRLWFATNNGISSWDPRTNSWKNHFNSKEGSSMVFMSLCEDNRGRIWAGTYASGIYIIDSRSGKLLNASLANKNDKFPEINYVFDIFKDHAGDIWIGGLGEIYCYREKENRFSSYTYQAMYAFAELDAETMVLTTSNGLVMLNKRSGNTQRLLEGHIFQDIVIKDSKIWALPMGEGLISYDLTNKHIEKFTTRNGLPSDFLNSALMVDDYMWLGSENGICRFDIRSKKITTFPQLLQLSSYAYNRNASAQLQNGDLVFGSNKGVILFNPNTINSSQSKARIFVNDIKVSGRSIRDFPADFLTKPIHVAEDIKLGYDKNNFTLDLIPLGNSISGSKFSWKLEGVDKDWSEPSFNRLINYSNLPAGKLKLKIRLYNSSLSSIIAEHTVRFEITPPFWKTWWFMSLALLGLTAAIYFAFKTYIDKLKHKHAEDKIRFFANTAHDLRNSLVLVKGPIDELTQEDNLSATGQKYLSVTRQQVKRLSMVASQLLDFQKADTGKEPVSLKMVDVGNLLKQRIYMFQSLAQVKKVSIVLEPNQPELLTAVDENAMEKVIDNLLSNAIKYSKEDSNITVVLSVTATFWKIEVTDKGMGICKNDQKKIFKEFYRSQNAINSKIVGSGIGLLLVKNYVKLHGGTVSFESVEGEGSTFRITVPVKSALTAEKGLPAPEKDMLLFGAAGELKIQTTENQLVASKALRILIVEDNGALRDFIQSFLQKEFEVLAADNANTAWDMINTKWPDLVISDVMMEGMNGHELCKLIKSTYQTSHIPVILLTALNQKEDELHGLGLGADDYLTKPFDTALLKQRIKTIIYNRKVIREKALKLINRTEGEKLLNNEHNDHFVKEALFAVRENIENAEFGKEAFAKAMLVSPSLLYKKLKALTDQSPSDFIKVVRLNYALELLKEDQYTVSEISEKCGFTSVNYFSTAFKKHFGIRPSEVVAG